MWEFQFLHIFTNTWCSQSFSIWVILTGVQWYSFVLFTCISLKTKWHWVFFKVLTCNLYIFHKIVCSYLSYIFIRLCSSFRVLRVLCILRLPVLYQIHDLRMFSLSPWLVFAFFQQYLPKIQSFKFWWGPVYPFIIWCIFLLDMTLYLRNLCLIHIHKDFLLFLF